MYHFGIREEGLSIMIAEAVTQGTPESVTTKPGTDRTIERYFGSKPQASSKALMFMVESNVVRIPESWPAKID